MNRFAIWLALALGAGAIAPVAAEDTAASVLACMRASVPPTLRVRDIELTTTAKDGASETLKGKLYAMREARDGEIGPPARDAVHPGAGESRGRGLPGAAER